MKHIFIVNPVSGKGKAAAGVIPEIEQICKKRNLDYSIYITKCAGDAKRFSRETAEASGGEHIRFYACGGDGTLYEVVNGSYGFENVEIAVLPLGSGNDFIRLFGSKEQFLDIGAQIDGTPVRLDLIKCGDQYAINQCSMGIDAEICAKQAHFKKFPVFNGETAYTASLVYCLLRRNNNVFTIQIDDREPIKMKTLFALCGNSRYYGGGYKGAPLAEPDDGLLDCIIVEKDVPTFKLIGLIGAYKKGNHLSWKRTNFFRGKKMTVHSEKPAAVNVDGECRYVTDSTFEIVEKAVSFVVPATSDFLETRRIPAAMH